MEEENKKEDSLQLELGVFEGPLDLLLHLTNQLEIDIYDIPIAQITQQYMNYLKHMQTVQIDVASEYFVMAATLMRIKSEMLVPRNENQAELGEDFYEEEDPRKPLMELLLEYKQIKEVVPQFEERSEARSDYFGKDPSDISAYRETIELEEQGLNADDLANVFLEILQRHRLDTPQPTTIETDEVTVVERMADIRVMILNSKLQRISFSELIENPTRPTIVVTFLALLELIKENHVFVQQDSIHSDISISIVAETQVEKQGSDE